MNIPKACIFKVTVDWIDFWAPYTRIVKEPFLYKIFFNELKHCDNEGYMIKVENIYNGS